MCVCGGRWPVVCTYHASEERARRERDRALLYAVASEFADPYSPEWWELIPRIMPGPLTFWPALRALHRVGVIASRMRDTEPVRVTWWEPA